jgi:hypothetical protein
MTDLGSIQRRVRGYWFVDGLQEITGGAALAIAGALSVAATITGNDSLSTAGVYALVLTAVCAAVVVRVAKRQVTYVRTGWVREPRTVALVKLAVAVAWTIIAAPLLATFLRGGELNTAWALAAIGIAVGVGAASQAWLTGTRRFYVQAVVFPIAGIAVALAGLDFRTGFATILLTGGLSLLATGGFALREYLRANPVPDLEGVVS